MCGFQKAIAVASVLLYDYSPGVRCSRRVYLHLYDFEFRRDGLYVISK